MSTLRPSLAMVMVLALAGGQPGCGRRQSSLGGAPPTGLVLITIDTLRADHLGCYGAPGNPTPRIDELASTGVTFLDASTPAPITLPAHASIFTGVSPPVHGVRDNGDFRLGLELPTMAGILQEHGWSTSAFVGAVVLYAAFGIDRGFAHFDDDIGILPEDLARMTYPERRGAQVVDAALEWLANRPSGSPFFLWTHLFDPHAPYEPPEPFHTQHGSTYGGEVSYTDFEVGRLLDGLAELGLDSDTLVVLTSDHGEGLGEHGETTHGFFLYQSTMHVPLVLSLPGRLPSGRRISEPVSLLDILPTLLDVLGLRHPPDLEGRSLLSAAVGSESPPQQGQYLETFLPYFQMRWSGSRALRDGRWKYIDAPVPELYDLITDPQELTNLADGEEDVRTRLASLLQARTVWMDVLRAPAASEPGLEELAQRQIRSLGYLSGGGLVVDDSVTRGLSRPDTKLRIHLVDELQKVVPAAVDRGDPRALERLQQLQQLDPDNPRLLTVLGKALEHQGEPAAALTALQRAAELEPDDPGMLGNLALLLAKKGREREAAVVLDRALALDSADNRKRTFLASLMIDLGLHEEGETRFREILRSNPDDIAAVRGLARALSGQQRWADLVPLTRRWQEALPDSAEAWALSGEAVLHLGDRARAREHLQRSLRLKPGQTDTEDLLRSIDG